MNRIIPAVLTAAAVFSATTPRMAHSAEVPADIAEMKVQDLRVGEDAQKRYFVIHRPAEPPHSGWRTLFVLPGGSGHADFQAFVTRIAKKALPEGYLVVPLVAPVGSG